MKAKFKDLVEALESKCQCQCLMGMTPVIAENVPSETPMGGVYLFSEGGRNLYAGRTKRCISVRIRNHFNTAKDCPFAWRLVREATGIKVSYRKGSSRRALLNDPRIADEYQRSKDRIRKMNVRYVDESDPVKQALLEIYVSLAASTPYNDFNTS